MSETSGASRDRDFVGKVVIRPGDGRPACPARCQGHAGASFGALHGAVNNAGIASESHEVPELPVEVWGRTLAVNVSAHFYGMRAQLPAIERSGRGAIVNVSSVYATAACASAPPTAPASTPSAG